ncbi:glycosyltransferase, partial [Microbacterium paludicola]
PPATAAEEPAPHAAAVRLIRASLVFDQEWYETQLGREFDGLETAIAHYLESGRRDGLSPHPLFVPAWVRPEDWRDDVDPLLSYLRGEDGLWQASTSPLFDPDRITDGLEAGEYGPLTAFLRDRDGDAPLPYDAAGLGLAAGLTLDAVRPFLLAGARRWHEVEHTRTSVRGSSDMPETAPEIADALAAFAARGEQPLVSVVAAVRDDAESVDRLISSVAAQTHERWELIVADLGSTDDTPLAVEAAAARDARVRLLRLADHGAAAAYNAALAEAGGEWVAFVDTAADWTPEFLRSMIAFLEEGGHDAGYAIAEVRGGTATTAVAGPETDGSPEVHSSIPLSTVLVKRALLARVPAFDESLGGAVDDDFVLSLATATELVRVPLVGVAVDPRPLTGWHAAVHDRRRWSRLPDTRPGLLTVVIDDVATGREAFAALDALSSHVGAIEAEYVLVARGSAWADVQTLLLTELARADVRVILAPEGSARTTRLNRGLREARGEHVFVTTAALRFRTGTLADLVQTMREAEAAAVHPVVLDAQRLIADAGVIYGPHGSDPVALMRGLPEDWPTWAAPAVEVPGAPLPLLLRATTVRAIRGMNPRLRRLWADVDLAQRAARAEGKAVVLRTDVVAQALRPSAFAPTDPAKEDVLTFAELWPDPPTGSRAACDAAGASAVFGGFRSSSAPRRTDAWTHATWRPAPLPLQASDRPERLQWAIKTAAPADDRAEMWGDFHFAQSLAAALRDLGQRVSIDFAHTAARATAGADDVVLTLRGLNPVPLPATATSVVWVISHPDEVTADELAAYDLRYAASTIWARRAEEQWGRPVTALLQCTDPDRFYIDDTEVPELAGKLLMVGNSRRAYRPAAWHAAHAGLPVVIYGSDWEEYVGEQHIGGTHIPNDELRRYYRSAAWSLNDHWPDMREAGFLSNRVFDVLASGGRLLTDDVAGLQDVLPGGVLPHGIAAYSSPAELLAIAARGPAEHYDDASLRAASDHVRSAHSFAARARVILEDVRRHRARRPL